MNCAVWLTWRQDPLSPTKKPTSKCEKIQCDLANLTTPQHVALNHTDHLNTHEDLIRMYLDQFEGIGQFSSTYHITLRDYAKPDVHAPRKCLIVFVTPVAWKPG